MNTLKSLTVILMLTCSVCAFAQHRGIHHYHFHHYHGAYFMPGHTKTVTVSRTTNRFSKKDRLEMAIAYLKNNKALSISKYSKMTGLTSATAEAELDAFSACRNNRIAMVMNGKKKMYVLT